MSMASFVSGQSFIVPTPEMAVDAASQVVDRHIAADKQFGDLSDLVKVPTHKNPSVSGLNDFDYPNLTESRAGLSSLPVLSNIRRVPLPAELVEQFGHMQCNCMMGLFPEISRAWLSIDSDIFVWRYEDGGDLAYFDGLNETIISAGLVKPKPGIFQPHIQYLLCLATPVDIVLLGVSFARPHGSESYEGVGEMHLLPDPLFSIPTDNAYILNITGNDDGRVFMASKDGCLYELVYQAEDGWFSRKCRKINHSTSTLSLFVPSFLNFSFAEDDPLVQISIDDSRHILYTRSEKGTIQVFDLGEEGTGMSRVAAVSESTTVQNAALVAKTIDRSNFKPIIHIAAITKQESTNIHLVAVTHAGVRLYFTTNPFNSNNGRPNMLTLVHVRLPPGFATSASPQRPNKVHMAHYFKGSLLMSAAQGDDNDLLWTVSPDCFPFQPNLMEVYNTNAVDGRSWALAEVPNTPISFYNEPLDAPQKANPPQVVTQHMEPVRRFVLLTAQGSHLMNKLRPVDQLRQLLLDKQGPDAAEVEAFFCQLSTVDQACATCLILACSKLAVDKQLAEWATRAFFMYGGEPKVIALAPQPMPATTVGPTFGKQPSMYQQQVLQQSFSSPSHYSPANMSAIGSPVPRFNSTAFPTPGPGMQPNQMSTPYPGFEQQQQPQLQQSLHQSFQQPMASDITYSGKHDGLCKYLGRVLAPIWNYKVAVDLPYLNSKGVMQLMKMTSRLRGDELSLILDQLTDLQDWMQLNSQFTSMHISEGFGQVQTRPVSRHDHGGQVDEQTRRRQEIEAQAQEKVSLQNLEFLLGKVIETLGLWKILSDHQFHIISWGLSREHQNQLRSMTFRQFVGAGRDMCKNLIDCLITRYLGDNATTDAISGRLREVCPSLYSQEDAFCSKANEMLQSAKNIQNTMEKEKILIETLSLYKQITPNLDLANVCSQFSSVRFYEGVVDLCLVAAAKCDPQNLALHYYRSGEPPEDAQGCHMFGSRMGCYRNITDVLRHLMDLSASHPQAPNVPKSPGPPPPQDPDRLTNTEAEQYVEQIIQLCLKTDDEIFHIAFYDWLIENGLIEQLLQVQSSFLENYLKKTSSMQPDKLAIWDLLWKYYEKNGNYSAAAKILSKLADRHSTDMKLTQRLEYLSRAIISAKSSTLRTSSASEGEFLHELEEKMEVARLQLQIYESLARWQSPPPQIQEALSRLDCELLDITGLYGEFADPFELSECKLAIIHCAGHYDPTLVESLWQSILDKEFSATTSKSATSQMSIISSKIISLGKQYKATDRYFPLAFLLKLLEQKSCDFSFDYQWAFRLMLEIGVPLTKLQEMYDRLFKSKDPHWQQVRKPLHLLHVIHSLLAYFTATPSFIPAYERRSFITTCLDSVAGYLVELQSMSSTNTNVVSLTRDFKSIQSQLERLS